MPRTPVPSLLSLGPVEPSLLCFPTVSCCLSPHTYECRLSSGLFPLAHNVFISFFKNKKSYSHLSACPFTKVASAFPPLSILPQSDLFLFRFSSQVRGCLLPFSKSVAPTAAMRSLSSWEVHIPAPGLRPSPSFLVTPSQPPVRIATFVTSL